jgi:hypothetical protein
LFDSLSKELLEMKHPSEAMQQQQEKKAQVVAL